jgi:hypothetical protein
MPFMGTSVLKKTGRISFVASFSDNILATNLHVEDTQAGVTVNQSSYGKADLSKGVSWELASSHFYVLVLSLIPISQAHGCSAGVVLTTNGDKQFDGDCNATVDQSNFIFQVQVN